MPASFWTEFEMGDTLRLGLAEAHDLILNALAANGVPGPAAASVARALVSAEAEGQVGHGFSRLEDYVAQVRSGKIRADAEVTVEKTGDAALLVDAGNGFAYPALDRAIEEALRLAASAGVASAAITRSHHCGALSVQVEKIAAAGCLGMMVANTPAAIAPWGAKKPLFGTNPIAFSAPRQGRAPLVIDLSLSRVARGKVMHAKKSGDPIPEGWALDAEGQPTTDPARALAGSMLPIGGPKGTSLALVVEVLAGVLTGANLSAEASSFFEIDGPPPGVGQFLLVFRPADATVFADRLERLLSMIEAAEGVRLPGARRAAAIAAAEAEGISVPRRYVEGTRRLVTADG